MTRFRLHTDDGDDDIDDPYGRPDEAFDQMARRLVPAIDILAGRQASA